MGDFEATGSADGGVTDGVADEVKEQVDQRPWVESLTQIGWVAKGVVYVLFGATATQIARNEPSDDEASPNGALNRLMEQPGGRILLGVLAVGLFLYALWRVLSAAVIRGDDLSAWLHRVGYGFSAVFYALLGFTAVGTVRRGTESESSSAVERLSSAAMEMPLGRYLVGLAGIVTVGVGIYFVVRKAAMRSFVDDLHGISDGSDDVTDRVVVGSGVAGWIGRGVVTALVGALVVQAAVQFDPDEARGFDGALKEVSSSSAGTVLVWVGAVGLILYGAFCLLSHRYRRIEDAS